MLAIIDRAVDAAFFYAAIGNIAAFFFSNAALAAFFFSDIVAFRDFSAVCLSVVLRDIAAVLLGVILRNIACAFLLHAIRLVYVFLFAIILRLETRNRAINSAWPRLILLARVDLARVVTAVAIGI